ncbi:MAG TPA: nicotinate-nicotinamide nucleotide adenylyltransferase [Candidatus Saccharimonadales bacterium]|nr:nicotinate-nicotinamide nucleotide adenylyltransferase [Candidatus Saccharimonadales bacterium]
MPLNPSKPPQKPPRVGIFAGTFDPVHKGHITFALKAAESADLDEVYFLPEIVPWRKTAPTHISHRLAMLQLATRAHSKLNVLELPDKKFDMVHTWPKLKKRFRGSKLLLIVGSDVFSHMPEWPHVKQLFDDAGVVVGTRGQRDIALTLRGMVDLNRALWEMHIVETDHPTTSSKLIRTSVAHGLESDMTLRSVQRYIAENWLYVDIRSLVSK